MTELFELGDAAGLVRIDSQVPLTIVARTANHTTDGSHGQLMPTLTRSDTFAAGSGGVLASLRGGESFRSNIGFVNLSDADCAVSLELRRPDGTLAADLGPVEVAADSQLQLNNVAPAGFTSGHAVIRRTRVSAGTGVRDQAQPLRRSHVKSRRSSQQSESPCSTISAQDDPRRNPTMKRTATWARIALCLTAVSLPAATGAALGTDWHPDPDGDGILSSIDLCPDVYDPAQGDADLDGTGNACDPDFAPPAEGGSITDLRVEHVTPYGAWLGLTSPHTSTWGWDVAVVWSTDPLELTTTVGIQAAYDRGDKLETPVEAQFGEAILEPVIVTTLTPATTYHATAVQVHWNGLDQQVGNLVTFVTQAAPAVSPAATRPRVMATASQIVDLQARRTGGDSSWTAWEALMRPRAHEAAVDPGSVYIPHHYCATSALLYLVGGDADDLSDALLLLDQNIAVWQAGGLDGNHYRWEDSHLGICTDLLWDHLDQATRELAVGAMLDEDERLLASDGDVPRLADTDETASITRNRIVDGLVACNATGIDSDLAARGCALLESGQRLWFGVQQVKTRRQRGYWAQNGGFLPDGSDYGQGTSHYWFYTARVLAAAGIAPTEVSPWLANNLRSLVLHLFTPSRLGFATAGDVEDFSYNYGVENDSFQLEETDAGLLALSMGVLEQAGDARASWARFLLDGYYDRTASADGYLHLLFEHDGLAAVDPETAEPTVHLDSGSGVLFDRSSWSADASYLFLRGGWHGPDHSHGDSGHFQLYRAGRWLTHEAIGYDGTAAWGDGHNVLLLPVPEDGVTGSAGQSPYVGTTDRMVRASSAALHSAITADLTGAYTPLDEVDRYWSRVQRSLLWLKTDEQGSPDTIVVRDIVQRDAAAPSGLARRWQLHLDDEPAVDVRHAVVTLAGPEGDQRVDVDLLLPADATLSVTPPEGPPDTYPAQVYTSRLIADAVTDTADTRFLVVLRGAASGDTTAAPVAVAGDTMAGALTGDGQLVLFADDPVGDGSGVTSLAVDLSTTDPVQVWLWGMAPGERFAVAASQNGATLSLTVTPGASVAADSGGLLAVTVDAARQVAATYRAEPIFEDGFESATTNVWSLTVG